MARGQTEGERRKEDIFIKEQEVGLWDEGESEDRMKDTEDRIKER